MHMPPMYLNQSMPPPPRDDRGGRRLSDRISGYADGGPLPPASVGLPAKPTPAALDQALSAGNGPRARNGGERGRNGGAGGPPPPPPPDAKEDPRAVAGRRISYHDMDLVAEVRLSAFVSFIMEVFTDLSVFFRLLAGLY